MTDYLIFRLYGPMVSWGDIAVGEVRPSYTHPSKSAVMGLVAAALGISRDDESMHRKLDESYGFAVLVNSIGTPLSDYHTAQVLPSGTGRNRIIFSTRSDEIFMLPREKLNTILSRRDYRMDALATVAIWAKHTPPYSLERLADALHHPAYVLYLGRKSCPLALPVEAQIILADTISDALNNAKFKDIADLINAKFKDVKEIQQYLPISDKPELYWEEGIDSGIKQQHIFERRDASLSRKRWQFYVRREYHASYPGED
jgi:CRISPR system Cascade subunit CasD